MQARGWGTTTCTWVVLIAEEKSQLQVTFKLFVLYICVWIRSFKDLFKVSSSPDKKEESTKEKEEEEVARQPMADIRSGQQHLGPQPQTNQTEIYD